MNMCMTVQGELPAWVWLLLGLGLLLSVGIWLTAVAEGLSERRSRMQRVRCGCAVRVTPREGSLVVAERPSSAPGKVGSQLFLLMVWVGSWA